VDARDKHGHDEGKSRRPALQGFRVTGTLAAPACAIGRIGRKPPMFPIKSRKSHWKSRFVRLLSCIRLAIVQTREMRDSGPLPILHMVL